MSSFLVCGLGNPGRKYDGTRHNVGFEAINRLASRFHFPASKQEKKGEVSRGTMANHQVLLVKPLTYMNLSGECVGPLMRYYRIESNHVIAIHDELDFEPGILRVKSGGGAGGNNGIKSLIQHIGNDFQRIRIGIGKPPPSRDGADWVLSRFAPAERREIDAVLDAAVDALEAILVDGIAAAMNRFNQKAKAGD